MLDTELLTRVLAEQADNAAEGAPSLRARLYGAPETRATRRHRWVVPALSAAAVVLVVVAGSAVLGNRHSPTAGPGARPTSQTLPLAPLSVDVAEGEALTHETLTVRTTITNSGRFDLHVNYPLTVEGPSGEPVEVLAGGMTGPDLHGIDSDAPPPTFRTVIPRGETLGLWMRLKLNCSQLALQQSWGPSYPLIRIDVDGHAPAAIPFSDVQQYDDADAKRFAPQAHTFEQLLTRACS